MQVCHQAWSLQRTDSYAQKSQAGMYAGAIDCEDACESSAYSVILLVIQE